MHHGLGVKVCTNDPERTAKTFAVRPNTSPAKTLTLKRTSKMLFYRASVESVIVTLWTEGGLFKCMTTVYYNIQ